VTGDIGGKLTSGSELGGGQNPAAAEGLTISQTYDILIILYWDASYIKAVP